MDALMPALMHACMDAYLERCMYARRGLELLVSFKQYLTKIYIGNGFPMYYIKPEYVKIESLSKGLNKWDYVYVSWFKSPVLDNQFLTKFLYRYHITYVFKLKFNVWRIEFLRMCWDGLNDSYVFSFETLI